MNKVATYKGHSVQEILEDLEKDSLENDDKLSRIDGILVKVKSEHEEKIDQMKVAFRRMADEDHVAPREVIIETLFELRVSQLAGIVSELLDATAYPEQYDRFSQLWEKLKLLTGIVEKRKEREKILSLLTEEVNGLRTKIGWPDDEQLTKINSVLTTLPNFGYLLYSCSQRLCTKGKNKDRDLILEWFALDQELLEFIEELSLHAQHLKEKIDIYDVQSGLQDSMKINWLGSATDLTKLIKFLKENRYIETTYINQFIAAHFLVKGVRKDAKSLGGLKPDRDGTFDEYSSYLAIPKK
ncbi:MAG: hypothetical protein WAZ99_11225 [Rectinemataceae bacterium]